MCSLISDQLNRTLTLKSQENVHAQLILTPKSKHFMLVVNHCVCHLSSVYLLHICVVSMNIYCPLVTFDGCLWTLNLWSCDCWQDSRNAVGVAELSRHLFSRAVLQEVPQDLWGAEQNLSGRLAFTHVEADLLRGLSSQHQTTVHLCQHNPAYSEQSYGLAWLNESVFYRCLVSPDVLDRICSVWRRRSLTDSCFSIRASDMTSVSARPLRSTNSPL